MREIDILSLLPFTSQFITEPDHPDHIKNVHFATKQKFMGNSQ